MAQMFLTTWDSDITIKWKGPEEQERRGTATHM
ncbi:hypothetical protein E2C01_044128 [Portunus trituberculatus]|uniref:Uncharacterized protein n=1 Tax=Portunus trituberculatus TaxID=210409 RepID=A0A5B7G1G0_PORTR|nr:hypothetical protein [Portunus trituberculatus]